MSISVENRVVELEFDNSKFERNVKDSLNSLEKLNNSLNMTGARSGIDGINQSIKSISLTSLIESVQKLADKFQGLGIIGTTALVNITNKAVNAGLALTKSLSVDQLTAGWTKYEDMIAAEQTIVAATGKSQEVVNQALDQLLWYTDETSYNFIDMANSIGKFTSNNVELFKSVDAMQGIASWAAISGQKTQQASMAMYNISQALGMGYLSVADWRSIELANMATAQFKDIAIETGKAVGTLVDYDLGGENLTIPATSISKLEEWIDKLNSGKMTEEEFESSLRGIMVTAETFRNTLSEKWFDSDVIEATLTEYGKFPTLLYESIQTLGEDNITTQKLLDDLDEYKKGTLDLDDAVKGTNVSVEALQKELVKLSDTELELSYKAFRAGQESKTLSDVISYTKDAVSSAWMGIYKSIFGDYEEAKTVWTPIANEAYEIFVAPVERIGEFVQNLKDNGGIDALFGGFANIYYSIKNIVTGITGSIRRLLGLADTSGIADVFAMLNKGFYALTENLKITEKFGEKLGSLFEPIGRAASTVVDLGKNLVGVIGQLFSGSFTALSGAFENIGVSFINFLQKVNTKLKSLFKAKDEIKDGVGVFDEIQTKIDNFSLDELIAQFKTFGGLIPEIFEGFKVDAKDFFEKIGVSLIKFLQKAREKLSTLFKIKDETKEIAGVFDDIQTEITKFSLDEFISQLQKLGKLIPKIFVKMLEGIPDMFGDIFTAIPEIADRIIGAIPKILTGIRDSIEKIGESIRAHKDEIHAAWVELLTPAREKLRSIGSGVIKDIADGASGEIDGLKAGGNGDGLKNVFMKILGVAYVGKELAFDTIRDWNWITFGATLKNFINGIGDLLESLAAANDKFAGLDTVKVSVAQKAVKIIKQLGLGLLAMAGAALIISSIPADQIKTAASSVIGFAVTVGVFIGGLQIVAKHFNTFSGFVGSIKKGEGLKIQSQSFSMASTLVAFGAAILLIALALKAITPEVSEEEGETEKNIAVLKVATGRIIWLMVAFAALIAVLGWISSTIVQQAGNAKEIKASSKVIKSFGLALIEMSIATLIISKAVNNLSETALANPEGFDKAIGLISAILTILTVIAIVDAIFSKTRDAGAHISLGGNILLSFGIAMFAVLAGVSMLVRAVGANESNMAAFDKVESFITTLVIIIGVIAVLISAFNNFGKKTGNNGKRGLEITKKTLLWFAIGVATLSAAIFLLGKALLGFILDAAVIGGILVSGSNVWVGLLAMVVMIGVIAAALYLIVTISKKKGIDNIGKKIAGISAGFILAGIALASMAAGITAIAVAIAAMGFAFSIVKSLGVSAAWTFVAVLVVLFAAIVLISTFATMGKTALAGAGILLLVGIAIGAAAVFLAAGIAALTVVVGAFFAATQLFANSITWGSLWNLLKVGAALIISAAILFVAGVLLGKAGAALIAGILPISIFIGKLIEMGTLIVMIGNNAESFRDGAMAFADVIGELLGRLKVYENDAKAIRILARSLKLISKSAAGLIGVSWIAGHDDEDDDYINSLEEETNATEKAAEANKAYAESFKNISNGTKKTKVSIKDAYGLYKTLKNGDISSLYGTSFEDPNNPIGSFLGAIAGGNLENLDINGLMSNFDVDPEAQQFFGMLLSGDIENIDFHEMLGGIDIENLDLAQIEKMFGSVSDAAENAGAKVEENTVKIVEGTTLAVRTGTAAVSVATDEMQSKALAIKNEVADIADEVSSIYNVKDFLRYAGTKVKAFQTKNGQTLSSIIEKNGYTASNYKGSITDLTDMLAKEGLALSDFYNKNGESLKNALAQGIHSAEALASATAEPLTEAAAKTPETGDNFAAGYINSINSHQKEAYSAAAGLGQASLSGLSDSIKEGSPSKLTYMTGHFFDLGFTNAINDGAVEAIQAAGALGQSAYKALTANIGTVSGVLAGKYTPKVAPVIDTGSYNSGLSYLTRSFNSARGDIARTAEVIQGARGNSDVTMHHEFADLTIRGVNDKDEFIEAANYSVDQILARIMRRQYRV